jgi:hypothetical protein
LLRSVRTEWANRRPSLESGASGRQSRQSVVSIAIRGVLRQHPSDQRVVADPAHVMLRGLTGPFGELAPSFRHHKQTVLSASSRVLAAESSEAAASRRYSSILLMLLIEFPEYRFGLVTTNQELALRSLQIGNTRSQSKSGDGDADTQMEM